ncbi:MAG: hypothetical protein A2Y28_00440 [Chlamydiae bacterium GWC2_50_10]|nr:MAG: hypothetical protein A2Z85_04875 [Chlamydiae bacterium GWA2_50_15]OGN53592.1 MAG: hypothetical protein A2Y28_00440 [Chlamydiae bacterium GWC2_50_10]OGN54964.1 MAG: hypothetical protein A2098_00585 [Chlamydiae bacterium GWF2_49_8]OGN57374.1 MAG: hypothetical protein A3D18_01950 [Chlamydiae bacterium RIFCSPHIGHO2_02_FULL_49_29]OGN64280.1 MAG: hypothetical protein A3E26_03990 [Chlamydiae bacterium RIFCSPHIGHO2_12_FULL_49_32]OGN67449.1 MAG: hypothetical protein A3I15_01900 [Chlamydiae bact
MYGLEKSKQRAFVPFDLEKELKADPKKAQQTLSQIESSINEIKNALRGGSSTENVDQLGILLHGYTALQRVLKRVVHQ